jgi:hypothetical protein
MLGKHKFSFLAVLEVRKQSFVSQGMYLNAEQILFYFRFFSLRDI